MLTILTAAGLLAVYLVSWYVALRSPLSVEYEGASLWAALQLAQGHSIYDAQRLIEAPWAVTIYTPLYFLLGMPLQLIGEYNYAGLRVLSILSFVVCMIFYFRLLSLYSSNRLNITVGMLILASYVTIWSGSFKARVDMMALAFSIAALYYGARAVGKTSMIRSAGKQQTDQPPDTEVAQEEALSTLERLYPCVLLTVAAVFAKLASIVILPAVCLSLAYRRRYTEMMVYGGASAAICLVLFLIINGFTDGGFWKHISFPFNSPFSFSDLLKHLELLGVDWPKLFMIPVIGLVWLEKTENKERAVLPFWIAIFSGILTALTIGGMHANLSHGMMFYFSLSWLFVIFLEIYPLSLATGMTLASALCTYIISLQVGPMYALSSRMDKAVHDIQQHDLKGKTIFVEDPALAIVCGAEPLFVDVATFLQIWERDKRSLADIEQGLSEKRYAAVIININDSLKNKPALYWPDSILRKIDENYQKSDYVVGNGDLQQLYIPK